MASTTFANDAHMPPKPAYNEYSLRVGEVVKCGFLHRVSELQWQRVVRSPHEAAIPPLVQHPGFEDYRPRNQSKMFAWSAELLQNSLFVVKTV